MHTTSWLSCTRARAERGTRGARGLALNGRRASFVCPHICHNIHYANLNEGSHKDPESTSPPVQLGLGRGREASNVFCYIRKLGFSCNVSSEFLHRPLGGSYRQMGFRTELRQHGPYVIGDRQNVARQGGLRARTGNGSLPYPGGCSDPRPRPTASWRRTWGCETTKIGTSTDTPEAL